MLHDEMSRLEMLLFKSDVWSYEKEFRLVCPRFTNVTNHPLIMAGEYVRIGENDLKSVILGCQVGNEAANTVKRLVEQHAPHVKVRQAVRSSKKYRLMVAD
jgi:hypothetical protein